MSSDEPDPLAPGARCIRGSDAFAPDTADTAHWWGFSRFTLAFISVPLWILEDRGVQGTALFSEWRLV